MGRQFSTCSIYYYDSKRCVPYREYYLGPPLKLVGSESQKKYITAAATAQNKLITRDGMIHSLRGSSSIAARSSFMP